MVPRDQVTSELFEYDSRLSDRFSEVYNLVKNSFNVLSDKNFRTKPLLLVLEDHQVLGNSKHLVVIPCLKYEETPGHKTAFYLRRR